MPRAPRYLRDSPSHTLATPEQAQARQYFAIATRGSTAASASAAAVIS